MKIAIIEFTERSYNYEDGYELVASKITDWEEIKDEDYNKVVQGLNYLSWDTNVIYTVVKFTGNQKEIIEISIKKAIEKYEKVKAEQEKRKIEEEEKKRKAKEKRELNKKMKELTKEQLFEELKKELGK